MKKVRLFARTPITLAVVAVLIVAGVPSPAQADGIPVIDIANLTQNTAGAISGASSAANLVLQHVKDYGLDPLAWAVAKTAIASMTKSMVNWINSGFNGAPSFVPNLQVYLGNLNYATANTFVNQLATNPAIRSPFQSQVASLLQLNFLKQSAGNGFFLSNPYTLNQVSTNDVGFVNGTTDFSSGGGWNAWFALTTQPANNVYGSYFLAQSELNSRLASAQNSAITQLNWGQGFLSWCGNDSGQATAALSNTPLQAQTGTLVNSIPQIDADGTVSNGNSSQTTVTAAPVNASAPSPQVSNCLRSDGSVGTIQTPGSVIQAQLNKTLGLTGDTLVSAHEFDEVIGALLGQLVNQVVGGVGLAGASSVSSGGTGYVDQAVSDQTATANGTAGADAGVTLSNTISSQLSQMTDYQTNWQTIGNEAGTASTSLKNCVAPPSGAAAAVASTTAAAQKGAAAAQAAIAGLNNVRNELTATANNVTAMAQATNDYQTLVSSPTIPSATDVAYVRAQAQDDTTATSTAFADRTLYGQMLTVVNQCALPLGI